MISPAALHEIHKLQVECDQLLSLRNLTRSDGKRADLIMARIASIRQAGLSTDETRRAVLSEIGKEIGAAPFTFDDISPAQRAHEEIFKRFLTGADDDTVMREVEHRATTFLSGSQTPIFSLGPVGGFLCPPSFHQQVSEAMAAVDPLTDESVVDVIQEPGFNLPALQVPGWDLSGIEATLTTEASQNTDQTIPQMDSKMLNRFMFRTALAASLEWETDSRGYGSAAFAMARALGISLARGVGKKLVLGTGTTQPFGISVQAQDSGFTTANASKFVLSDFLDLFFSVNKIYRDAPKAGWLCADSTLKQIHAAVDGAQRPLVELVNGNPQILGKPIYMCPNMPAGAGSKGLIFGDLGAFKVHRSQTLIRRFTNAPGYIENGRVRFHALQMVDSVLHDPSDGANSGAVSPCKFSTLHA
jgi:HK97 family phage major capsid protein